VNEQDLRHLLAERLAELVGIDSRDLEDDRPFQEYGLPSRETVQLVGELEDLLGRALPVSLLWDHPTIAALSRALSSAEDAAPVAQAVEPRAEPVAVIGIGCRLPGGVHGPVGFWRLLREGADAVGEIPPTRWEQFAGHSPGELDALGRLPRRAGVLDDIAGFDAEFFGLSPGEATAMDPQQRWVLETAWEALEHAAIAPADLRGTPTGVFVGVAAGEYGRLTIGDVAGVDAWAGTGSSSSITANRLSYALDLRGPSIAIDTACSSSLVAVHLAARSLRDRESSLALAAGANLLLAPGVTATLHQMGALSPSGRCAAFDAAADGYVRAEGVGVVVLKRLSDAVRDGDRVLAVVRGSAVNQDGRSNGLTAPNGPAQQAVVRAACAAADVDPADVDYVEAHGTGTPLGDPVEAHALGAVHGRGRAAGRPLLIGSVKTNLGHLEAAAGIVGLIKVVLALHHGTIPASLHHREPSPLIPFADLRLAVTTSDTAWPATHRPAVAGVSAFGFGGTNAHVVLEQAPPAVRTPLGTGPAVRELLVAAPTADRLAAQAGRLASWAAGPGSHVGLDSVAHTLHRRAGGPARAVVLARDHAELVTGLQDLQHGRTGPHVVQAPPGPIAAAAGGVVWMFAGQGPPWAGTGRRLLVEEPAFADALRELDPLFRKLAGFSLVEHLSAGPDHAPLDRVQPALFGLQIALAEFYRVQGLRPAAVIGHSVGEVAAAVVAGALTVPQGLRVVVERSRLLASLAGRGAMAALGLTAADTAARAADHPGVEVAVFTAPTQTVVAGPADQVAALVDRVAREEQPARLIDIDVAAHTAMVEPLTGPLAAALADLVPHPAQLPTYPTVLDDPRARPVPDARYWVANLRRPVRFTQAVRAALEDGFTAFLEVSAHPVLTAAVHETADAAGLPQALVAASLRRDTDETRALRRELAVLRLAGAIDPVGSSGEVCDLPTTGWRHRTFWAGSRPAVQAERGEHPLLGAHVEAPGDDHHLWRADLGRDRLPWLGDHRIGGRPLLSTGCVVEMALNAAAAVMDVPVSGIVLHGLDMPRPLLLAGSTPVTTVFGDGRVGIHTRTGRGNWVCHATAEVQVAADEPPPTGAAAPDGADPDPAQLPHRRQGGQRPGAAFDGIRRVHRTAAGVVAEVVADVSVPAAAGRHPRFAVHPVLLDCAVQLAGLAVPGDDDAVCDLPTHVGRVRVHELPGETALCRARFEVLPGGDVLRGSVRWATQDGRVLVELDDLRVRRFPRWELPAGLVDHQVEARWTAMPLPERRAQGEPVLLVSEDPASARHAEIAAALRDAGHEVTDRSLHALLDDATTAASTARHVVLAATGAGEPGCPHRAERLVLGAAALARSLAGGRSRLWLLTVGAAAVGGTAPQDPGPAALRGLVRVLAYEHPELGATWLDLPARAGATHLVAELAAGTSEDEIAWRDGQRYAGRLTRVDEVRDAFWRPPVRADGGYVVTGGLGGLGLAVARWLAERGAAKLVLNGRRRPGAAAHRTIDAIRAAGAAVDVVTGDLTAPGVAEELLDAAGRGAVPRGVVHAAAVMDARITARLDGDSLHRVWSPKATGAWRLHHATSHVELDWWLAFSSMSALLGWPGEPAYAAANAYLDALAGWRRSTGQAGSTVQWGPWAEIGKAAGLEVTATRQLTPAEGLSAFGALTGSDRVTTGLMKVDYDRLLVAHPELRSVPFFSQVAGDAPALADQPEWGGVGSLPTAPDRAARLVLSRLRQRVGDLAGFGGDLTPTVPLVAMGLDSLLAIRIRNAVQHDFGIAPPLSHLLGGATLAELGRLVTEHLGLPAPPEPPATGAAPHSPTVAFVPARDDAERLVAAVWEQILGTRVSVISPFPGGTDRQDELAAVLTQRSGLRLSREQWFAEGRTVQDMAALLRRLNGAVDTLRVLREGPGTPLVLFHPGGGDSWVYRPLVDLLSPSVPAVGFDRLDDAVGIADRADRYRAQILRRWPTGPFRLVGWSFGGFLAYEVAAGLLAEGHHVELVGLIDSVLPAGRWAGPDGLDETGLRHLAATLEQTYGRPVPLPYDEMLDADDTAQADLLVRAIAEANVLDPRITPAILRSQRAFHIEAMAVRRYRPPAYPGRVVLYRATQKASPAHRWLDRPDDTVGWDRFSTDIEVVPVDTHHFALLDPPHVHTIAAHLGQVLAAGTAAAS
jgi:phthiocerol/phenolphthiocerol synthesis type-I polyketide synthase D